MGYKSALSLMWNGFKMLLPGKREIDNPLGIDFKEVHRRTYNKPKFYLKFIQYNHNDNPVDLAVKAFRTKRELLEDEERTLEDLDVGILFYFRLKKPLKSLLYNNKELADGIKQ